MDLGINMDVGINIVIDSNMDVGINMNVGSVIDNITVGVGICGVDIDN